MCIWLRNGNFNMETTESAQAEWSGCVLRIAGHDFMDYNPQALYHRFKKAPFLD
jgi:hypothetical protein